MKDSVFHQVFSPEQLRAVFPEDSADRFFEALYGDAAEGAYDICLKFMEEKADTLVFEFHLTQRPGKCLRCNLTYGLPEVFSRHPVINLKGLVKKIDAQLDGNKRCIDWKLGRTMEISNDLHIIPLIITLDNPV